MDDFDEETIRELEEQAKSQCLQMKTRHGARMKTLSSLINQLPENHPDLIEFQQEWETERTADKTELRRIERMKAFVIGLDSTNTGVSRTLQSPRPGPQRSAESALPTIEKESSTESELSVPLITQAKRRRVLSTTRPQESSLPPLSPKCNEFGSYELESSPVRIAGKEADRFLDCPVIVRHEQLGWLEIKCILCGGNAQPTGKFILGIAGMSRHLSHKHSRTPTGVRQFKASYVLEHCARKLSADEVDAYAHSIEQGEDPVARRPCCHDDGQPSFDEDEIKTDNPSFSPSTNIRPVKRPRRDAFGGGSTTISHTRPTNRREARRSDVHAKAIEGSDYFSQKYPVVFPTKIIFEQTCSVICHHPTKGTFILACPSCQGNAFLSPKTERLEYLDPLSLYAHIRQAHPDTLIEVNGVGEPMHLSTFQREYLVPNCVERFITTTEYDKLMEATSSGLRYSPIAKVATMSVIGNYDTKFPTLCSEHFSSIVLRDDLKWVDLRCPHCNTNKVNSHHRHFQGLKGFQHHMTRVHGSYPPDPATSWRWLLKQCTRWSNHPEVDVEKIEIGVHVIPIVPPASGMGEQAKEEPATLIVKLKVSSLDYTIWREREMVDRIRAVLTTVSIGSCLEALRANKGNFDDTVNYLIKDVRSELLEIPESPKPDFQPRAPWKSVRTLDAPKEQDRLARMRRVFPLMSIDKCLSALRANGGNTDEAINQLMLELEQRSFSLFKFDPIPTRQPVQPKSRVHIARPYNPSTHRSYAPHTSDTSRTLAQTDVSHITIKTACPCSVTGHSCKLEGTCGRTMLCVVPDCHEPSCRNYHGIKSTCSACLEFHVRPRPLIGYHRRCVYGHDDWVHRLEIANEHKCYHH